MQTWDRTLLALVHERQERERMWRARQRLVTRNGDRLRRRVGESVVRLGMWLAAEPRESNSGPVLSP